MDGVSGVDITTVLFDLDREPAEVPQPEREWTPGPEPSDAEVVAEASGHGQGADRRRQQALKAATDPAATASGLRRSGRGRERGDLGDGVEGAGVPAQRAIGTHRRVTWVGAELAELKEIKNSLGGTVNDVFLAIVSGALANWLRCRGVRTEGLELRGAVPVSVRAEDEQGEPGNKITIMVGRLPTYCGTRPSASESSASG